MNKYREMKDRHEKTVNQFPMVFAFSDKQFKESIETLGLTEHDTDKVVSIGMGGFIRKNDKEKYRNMYTKINDEIQHEIDSDTTGQGFIKDMFEYELANHEFMVTYDLEPTLEALGMTRKEVRESSKLENGLKLAMKSIDDEHDMFFK